jgi:hypothetical protein
VLVHTQDCPHSIKERERERERKSFFGNATSKLDLLLAHLAAAAVVSSF